MIRLAARQQSPAGDTAAVDEPEPVSTLAEFYVRRREEGSRINLFAVTTQDLIGLGLTDAHWALWQSALDADSTRPPGPCTPGPETYLLLDGLIIMHRSRLQMPLTTGVLWMAALRVAGIRDSHRVGITLEDDWQPVLDRFSGGDKFTLGALCCAAGLSWAETGAAIRTGTVPPVEDLRMMAALRGLTLP